MRVYYFFLFPRNRDSLMQKNTQSNFRAPFFRQNQGAGDKGRSQVGDSYLMKLWIVDWDQINKSDNNVSVGNFHM